MVCVCITSLNYSTITVLLQIISGNIVPLQYLCVVALCIVVVNPIILGSKFISMKHPKTKEVERVSLQQLSSAPKHLIFNEKVQENVERVENLFKLCGFFGLMYVTIRFS